MKLTKFLAFAAMGAVALSSASCSDDDDDDDVVTPEVAISLSSTEAEVTVGATITLTATTANVPDGSTIAWTSSDEKVATVADGVVTGVAEGRAIITAEVAAKKATCLVTVKAAETPENPETPDTPEATAASLTGSNYYIIQLDAVSQEKIQDKIVANLAVDEEKTFLYVWENTYVAGEATGKNFYGEAESWVSLTVSTVGWSGCGFFSKNVTELNKLADVYNNPDGYYFHMAFKSTDQGSHLISVIGDGDTAGKFAIGDYTDQGKTYKSVSDITRDGEWNEIEIPMSDLISQGLIYGNNVSAEGHNIMTALSGGTQGVNLQMDAVFIYKK